MFVMDQTRTAVVDLTGMRLSVMDVRDPLPIDGGISTPDGYPIILVAFSNHSASRKAFILGYFHNRKEAQEELEAMFAFCGTGGTYTIRSC